MAALVENSGLGSMLSGMVGDSEILPGDAPSYELCKTLYLYHPFGARLAETPVRMAQSKGRKISVPEGPEDRLREAFDREWEAIGATKHIRNCMKLARVYGVASVAYGIEGVPSDKPVPPADWYRQKMYFSVFDPLNTAGSLVLNQNPNAPDFLKVTDIRVGSEVFHRSRACVVLNEEPVYIAYTSSAYGYVGRSVYQRALYPLKSYVRTMIADDMIAAKLGLLISKMEQPGSIIDAMMSRITGLKATMLKTGVTGNVLTIGPKDEISTLNMINADGAGKFARENVIRNIATAADMPAVLLMNDTFAAGFGEGTEDARAVAQYISALQQDMQPLYDYFDRIVMYRAWNPEFYETIKRDFPMYQSIGYENAFTAWYNSFQASWPSYIEEAPSDKVEVEKVRMETAVNVCNAILPKCDPENAARVIQFLADTVNCNKEMFPNTLNLDYEELAAGLSAQSMTPQEPFPHDAG